MISNLSATEALRQAATEQLSARTVGLVIGYERENGAPASTAAFVRKPEDAARLVFDATCFANLAVYLPRKDVRSLGKTGLVVKGCDLRAVNVLLREHVVARGDLFLIGVRCRALGEPPLDKCAACDAHEPQGCDLVVGEPVQAPEPGSLLENPREAATPPILAERKERGGGDATESIADDERHSERPEVAASLRVAAAAGRLPRCGSSMMPSAASPASPRLASGPLPPATQPTGILQQAPRPEDRHRRLAALEALSLDERWAFWERHLARCIRCYACRQACPLCYCKRCIVEKSQPAWVETSAHLRGNLAWNVARALHLAGRCVGCGECERVCPMRIPLRTIHQKMAKLVEDWFGFRSGLSADEKAPFTTWAADDPEEGIL